MKTRAESPEREYDRHVHAAPAKPIARPTSANAVWRSMVATAFHSSVIPYSSFSKKQEVSTARSVGSTVT